MCRLCALLIALVATVSVVGQGISSMVGSDFHMYMKELCNSILFDVYTEGRQIGTCHGKLQGLNGYQDRLMFSQEKCTVILKNWSLLDGQTFTITDRSHEDDVPRAHSKNFTVIMPDTIAPVMANDTLKDYTRNLTSHDTEENGKTVYEIFGYILVPVVILVLAIIAIYFWRKRKSTKKSSNNTADPESNNLDTDPSPNDDLLGQENQTSLTIDVQRMVVSCCKIENIVDPDTDISATEPSLNDVFLRQEAQQNLH
ncbi:uncharacterized protein LOC142101436 isoform X2 [Mixophyes fleayi]|uniref:uncharacterized protein LOC142101436 isoform X2 n=1 Tax=Mixophyes fleayi TaxID=3061075 RepID=UPI003F4D832E